MSILDLWLTIFRAEDEMNQILCKGLGHFVRPEKQVSVFPCRFRADVMIAARYPERRSTTSLPWADFRCPYRAIEPRLSQPRAALEDELALGWFPLPRSGQRPDVHEPTMRDVGRLNLKFGLLNPKYGSETLADSIPNILFVKFNFMPLQQRTELVLKCPPRMMSLLIGDVLLHGFHGRLTHGECPITTLPVEVLIP